MTDETTLDSYLQNTRPETKNWAKLLLMALGHEPDELSIKATADTLQSLRLDGYMDGHKAGSQHVLDAYDRHLVKEAVGGAA